MTVAYQIFGKTVQPHVLAIATLATVIGGITVPKFIPSSAPTSAPAETKAPQAAANEEIDVEKAIKLKVYKIFVIAIGDLHIPERAIDLPHKFKKLLTGSSATNKIQQVLCTGNVTTSQSSLDFLKSISSDFHLVKGECDQDTNLPLSLILKSGDLKIGILNGFNVLPQNDPISLLSQARLMDIDILIWGGTSKVEAYTLDGKFFINPGSATGAFSTNLPDKEDLEIIDSILKEKINNDNPEDDTKKTNSEEEEQQQQQQPKDEDKEKNTEETDGIKESNANDQEDESQINEEPKLDNEKNGEQLQEEKSVEDGEVQNEINCSNIEPYVDPVPSFCLLDVQGYICTLYIYTHIEGEVKVDKVTYTKSEDS
ncbi:hypothetical protein PACTADRAFT_15947 [Pachysolen tannophilus NRRL Y-2460]|uniref:Vacuolar protein sorting-associated protein 29 n=1 Tax=Pachysolen tannophilus NRRL Y-2460 TaxID=669874 RepID=A0A1E4TVI5_PACTA|nr:hypothetical protein PACTADRAFT_15947 [Pachysolen tannophilus NRRL Y-2460]